MKIAAPTNTISFTTVSVKTFLLMSASKSPVTLLFTPRHSQSLLTKALPPLRGSPLLAQLAFAYIVVLLSYIHTGRFSCKHEICLYECTSEVHSRHSQNRHFVALRCLRSSLLLISWRSLRTFMQADFHVNMKSARTNVRVNWNNITSMFHVKHFL